MSPTGDIYDNITVTLNLKLSRIIVIRMNERQLATTEMFAENLRTIIIFTGNQNTIYVLKSVLLLIFLKKHSLNNCMQLYHTKLLT